MSLISCPECDKEISDKVKACPHCGYPFGGGSESREKEPQKVEITSVKLKKIDPEKRKKIFLSIVSIIIIMVGIFSFIFIDKMNEERALRSEYIDTLNLTSKIMLNGASDSETLCNLISKVWFNTVYEERDSITDEYTMFSQYHFYSDFNSSLANLFEDARTKSTIKDIEDNQKLVEKLIRQLQNPTIEFEKAYENLMKLYVAYRGVTDLAINPNGSLTFFSERKTSKIDAFMVYYKKLNTQMPEKEIANI